MVISAKEHQYCSGSQHTQTKAGTAPPLVSVCATGVFFWASEAGAERWPIDKEAMDAFHKVRSLAGVSVEEVDAVLVELSKTIVTYGEFDDAFAV